MLLLIVGCGRATPQPQPSAKHPTVASLVPAATDLLLAMGARDHLLAVSNFEPPRAEISGLPKVGDYQSTDWEQLAQLRPDVMLIFMSPAHTPPGLLQRADELHIRVLNVSTDHLADIFATIDQLGAAVGEPSAASILTSSLHQQLDSIHERVRNQPPVRTLLSLGDDRFDLVGRGTYLNELLGIAGGENALPASATAYPTLDRERVMELKPDVVIQLAPTATVDSKKRAEMLWLSLADRVPAVRQHRIVTLDDPYALQPGAHVGEIAGRMAKAIHPDAFAR